MKPTIKGGLCQRLLREHMFASLCRNRSSRTLLLLLLPTLFLYVAWSSSRFRRRGESSFTMCIFTHETRTNQLDIKWDAAITAIQHLGIFIDFDWCSNAWWWKEKVLVYHSFVRWFQRQSDEKAMEAFYVGWTVRDEIKKNCILVRTAWSILAETEEPKVLSQFVWNRNLSRTDLSRFLDPCW